MKPMAKIIRVFLTVINMLLILVLLCGIIMLSVGTMGADRTGTFNLFGYSFHLNKSSSMAPAIDRNDLVVVKHTPVTDFTVGDLIAFYQSDGKGGSDLLIRRLDSMDGSKYTITDEEGAYAVLRADNTRFLGVAVMKSAPLGQSVLFLQSDSGRTIFLWWACGILFLLIGIIILIRTLLHMIVRRSEAAEEPTLPDEPIAEELPIKDRKLSRPKLFTLDDDFESSVEEAEEEPMVHHLDPNEAPTARFSVVDPDDEPDDVRIYESKQPAQAPTFELDLDHEPEFFIDESAFSQGQILPEEPAPAQPEPAVKQVQKVDDMLQEVGQMIGELEKKMGNQ